MDEKYVPHKIERGFTVSMNKRGFDIVLEKCFELYFFGVSADNI